MSRKFSSFIWKCFRTCFWRMIPLNKGNIPQCKDLNSLTSSMRGLIRNWSNDIDIDNKFSRPWLEREKRAAVTNLEFRSRRISILDTKWFYRQETDASRNERIQFEKPDWSIFKNLVFLLAKFFNSLIELLVIFLTIWYYETWARKKSEELHHHHWLHEATSDFLYKLLFVKFIFLCVHLMAL